MAYNLRFSPPLPLKPRPVWWRRVRCSIVGHGPFRNPTYHGTITCLRCKETWP